MDQIRSLNLLSPDNILNLKLYGRLVKSSANEVHVVGSIFLGAYCCSCRMPI